MITSDGDKVSNPKYFKKHYQRLQKDPKNLSRKQKGSKNREKARIKVDRWFPSSKRCSNCGYIAEKMPLNVREWDCPDCGTHHDRDINASKNILGSSVIAMQIINLK